MNRKKYYRAGNLNNVYFIPLVWQENVDFFELAKMEKETFHFFLCIFFLQSSV